MDFRDDIWRRRKEVAREARRGLFSLRKPCLEVINERSPLCRQVRTALDKCFAKSLGKED